MDIGNYQIKEGLSEKQIGQLIHFSNTDPEILKNTTDQKRFKDRKSFEKWLIKTPKLIFTLTNAEDDLLGIVWFPKAKISLEGYEEYGISFAIRLYPPARGKGLSKPFAQKAMELLRESDFCKIYDRKGIWLDSMLHNTKAHSLYEKLGFKKVAKVGERIAMILPQD